MTTENSPKTAADIASCLSDTQRNGSITGIGIVLGFSLSFIATWSFGSGKWRYLSLIALAIAGPGVVLQLLAFLRVLALPPLSLDGHKRAIKLFLLGVSIVFVAYVVHVLVDVAMDKHWFGIR